MDMWRELQLELQRSGRDGRFNEPPKEIFTLEDLFRMATEREERLLKKFRKKRSSKSQS